MSADSNKCERSRTISLVFSSKRPSVRLQWQFEACNGPTPHNHKMPWEAHRPCKCGTAGPLMTGTAAVHTVAVIGFRPRTSSTTEYALDLMLCMPSQHHAIASGLQTDCMVVVPAPVVRLPDSHVYALWP